MVAYISLKANADTRAVLNVLKKLLVNTELVEIGALNVQKISVISQRNGHTHREWWTKDE